MTCPGPGSAVDARTLLNARERIHQAESECRSAIEDAVYRFKAVTGLQVQGVEVRTHRGVIEEIRLDWRMK